MPLWPPRPAGRPPSASSGQLSRVGLVLGEYDIYSRDLNDWPDLFREEDFNLILRLAGSRHWGADDFGMHCGIMYLAELPYRLSRDMISFQWRAREEAKER